MAIRECALKNPYFAKLFDAYQNRDAAALAFKAKGGKVLAKLGFDVPDELVLAAGLMPVQVYADPDKELVYTNKILEFAFDPMVRKQFEKMIDGTYKDLADYLVVSNSTDVLIRVFLYLRELIRSEPEMPVPPTAFIDWLFTRNRMHQERNELTINIFKAQLEDWTGKKITDEEIADAAKICNENRAALRKIGELRHGDQVRVNGTEALVIIGSGFFMDKKEHTDLVNKLAEDAASWSFSSKKAFVSQRVETLNNSVAAAKADAVMFYTNIYEDSASWDYPSQKKSLDDQGIKNIAFAKMQYPADRNEGLADSIAEFFKG